MFIRLFKKKIRERNCRLSNTCNKITKNDFYFENLVVIGQKHVEPFYKLENFVSTHLHSMVDTMTMSANTISNWVIC